MVTLKGLAAVVLGVLFLCSLGVQLPAQEEGTVLNTELLTSKDWKILHLGTRKAGKPMPVPANTGLRSLDMLQFTGPAPGHPFDLGEFSADSEWNLVTGYLIPRGGKNSALQVAYADQFELEGVMDVSGFGGWFILVGWDQGRGFSISNVTMKSVESGSPWFLTSYRGDEAIEGTHEEFPKFEWKGEQPFKLVVKGETVSLQIGRTVVFNGQPLTGYAPGAVVIGTYDTRYGPKKIRIKSLRIRAIEEDQKQAKKGSQ